MPSELTSTQRQALAMIAAASTAYIGRRTRKLKISGLIDVHHGTARALERRGLITAGGMRARITDEGRRVLAEPKGGDPR